MFKKIKNWIIGLFIGSAVLAGGFNIANKTPDITKEKMQVAYEQSNIKAKYKMKNASFVMEAKNKNAIQIEVGDKTKQEFTPEIKIAKWDNEVSMKVKPKINTKSKKKELKLENNKIKYKQDKKEFHFYDVKKGDEILGGATSTIDAYEVEVILLEKPTSNIIEMEIETQGLDFYYQPALNIEMASSTCTETDCGGSHRPENVVGSYAVYHSEKQGDYSKMGGKNYRVGKAFHIYRPKIIDSAGKEVWGKLNIDEKKGILSVEIPQEFLDNAVYPVIVDPTFGCDPDSPGASYLIFDPNDIKGTYYTSPATINVAESISWHSAGTYNGNFKGIIVLGSNKNIISNGVGDATAWSNSVGWFTSSFSTNPSLSANTEYVLSTIHDYYYKISYDSVEGIDELSDKSNNYTTPTDPTDATIYSSYKLSIYCTYTTGGSSDTCTYSGSGDWNVNYSDNCYVTSETYVLGDFNLIYDGAGSFNLQANLKCDELNIGAGASIYAENSTAKIQIY